jgi:hypothetical protein
VHWTICSDSPIVSGNESRQNIGRVIFVVVLAAVLIAVFALGWEDDNARPCSQGRAQVTCPPTHSSP